MGAALRESIDALAYVGVRLAVCVIQALPLSTCAVGSNGLAWLMWRVIRLRRAVIEENLEIAFPESSLAERQAIAVGMWRHLFLMVCELAHAPRKIRRTNWRRHSSVTPTLKPIARQLLSDRPTVILSGHLGNFEMGGYLLGIHGFSTHTVVRPLDNRRLGKWIDEFRSAKGQHLLPREGSGPQIDRLLDRGGTLVLLGDQFAYGKACWVDFFGKPAATHKAVALFTLSAAAPTAVCAVVRRNEPLCFEMIIADLVDPLAVSADGDAVLQSVPQAVAWYTSRLEGLIRRCPDQYWWLHRRWKGDPPSRATVRT